MSVIKQIQLEDINGSLTELADIGAKAENIEFDNSDSGLEATNLQDAIVEITESGITGLKYTVDGDNNTHATIQNATEDGTIGGEPYTKNVAIGEFSHAEGFMTTASGPVSHVEGELNQTIGPISHAEGNMTTASGPVSHAEGENTLANGSCSHAEGFSTNAQDRASHAEGEKTLANGSCSHAEGNFTTAVNENSHAEGIYTIAEGYNSHAEGSGGIKHGSSKIIPLMAIGHSSHAEGGLTTAMGISSHAEGSGAFAGGDSSHAEGYHTNTIGDHSHAQNNHTIAQGEDQTVIGKYNIPQGNPTSASNTDYAFIIGNGTNVTPSNAFAVQWNGAMSQDNGTTSFKFTKDADGNKGYIDENGNFNTFGSGSGSGDMLTSVYDPNSTVANAGGIVNYVAAHSSTDLSWVTPQDYGAKGDGVTDDTDAIVAAETAANNGSKVLYFPAGTYKVRINTVRCHSGMTWFGDSGKSIIIIDSTTETTGGLIIAGQSGIPDSGSGITIHDLIFRGTETYGSSSGGVQLFTLWNGNNCLFHDCVFQNNKNLALVLISSNNINVHNCRFEATDCGIEAMGNYPVCDVSIRECYFSGISSYNGWKNFSSEPISSFCSKNNESPNERWIIENCVFEQKLTNAILFSASGVPTMDDGVINNKDMVVRNCTFRGLAGCINIQKAENVLVDGIFVDDTDKDSEAPFNINNIIKVEGSKNITVRNVTSKCQKISFNPFGVDAYCDNVLFDGVDAYAPARTSNEPFAIFKGNNITVKNMIAHPIATSNKVMYVQFDQLTNSTIDIRCTKDEGGTIVYYAASGGYTSVTNNNIVVDTKLDIRRNVPYSTTTSDDNDWILIDNGSWTYTALTSINTDKLKKRYIINVSNQSQFDALDDTTDFKLMQDGYEFYLEFVASIYSAGKSFSINNTGNIIPINLPITFSNDYKIVCHFIQKNAKWVEVERTLEYYEGANINILYEQDLRLVTPQEYGAKGDGETDDTNAINSAIQDALANDKCVFFPSGEYLVKWSGIITNVTSNLTIFGNGYKTSVIRIDTPYTTNDSQGIIFQNGNATKASNLTLKDIGIVYDDNDDSIVLPDDERRTVQVNGFFKDIIMDSVYIHIGGSATTLPKNDCVWFQCGANKIIVKNCLIENFSNRDVGGSLWITPVDPTGTISRIIGQVQILNNEIRNTNRDEAIGIWQRSGDTDFNCHNVTISGNKILHQNWNGECYATNNLLTCYAKEGNVIDVNYVITNNSFITSKMNTQPIKFAGLNGVIFKDNESIIQGRISGGNNNFLLCERGGQVLIESNLFNYLPDTYQCEFTINNNDVDFIRNIILSNRPVYFKNNTWSGSEEHTYNIVNNIIHINPSYNLVIRKNAEFGNIIFTNNIVDTGLIFYNTPVGEGLVLKNNKFNNGSTKTITDVKGDSLVFEYNDGIILNVSNTNITTPMDNFNYIGLSDDLQFTQNGSIVPDSNAVRQAFFTVNNIIYINAINLLQLALQNSTTFDDFKALVLGS